MRILLVHSGNAVGGDSSKYTFVREQGEELRKLGCEIAYYAVVGKGMRGYLRNVKPLRKKIQEWQPDIVHAHFGLCGMVAVLAAGKKVPVVITCHNGETLTKYGNMISSFAVHKAAYTIYVEQHIRDLSYYKAKKYSIIPCGVPMEEMVITPYEEARQRLGWDANKKYILFGGAFDNLRKNYPFLRQAVERVKSEEIRDKSEEVRDKSEEIRDKSEEVRDKSEEIRDKSEELRVKSIEIIEMKGLSRAECVMKMCACDLFALPSHSEGSPQALKEAMAVNTPSLATDIADVRVLFGNEPGYWILRNPNKTNVRWDADEKSLDEMVELLQEALQYKGRTKGRDRILELQLSNEQIAARILKIYEQVKS